MILKINKKDLFDLLSRLSGTCDIFVPYKKSDKLHFGRFDPQKEETIELGIIRQSQPFKSFLTQARENVTSRDTPTTRTRIVAGVKGCDLKSLKLQDFVFGEGDVKDPFYLNNRERTVIISHDCTDAKETCFCMAMDGAPYPEVSYDINLSLIGDYYIADIATDRGAKIIEPYKTFFKKADQSDMARRDANRKTVCGKVLKFIEARKTPRTTDLNGAVEKKYDTTQLWKDMSSTCVECGACNLVCPTCHCFLLCDTKYKDRPERMRLWDACLYNTFARVAGGANPRRHLYERLRNRFDKKFAYFPKVLNYYACTGCGRCIEACPGNIDLREVLKGLVGDSCNKPPHD